MNKYQTAEGVMNCGPAFTRGQLGGQRKHPLYSSVSKAPVSIYKTETSYEVMVFAPGRIKENFSVTVSGEELMIAYHPTDDTSSFDWIRKEYSRGGFERTFLLDHTLDAENINASYIDGVLKISLKILPGSEPNKHEVKVN